MKIQQRITKKVLSVSTALVLFSPVFSQQSPNSNFYNFNEYLLNPAEAGAINRLYGTVSHRVQWQGLEGAPTSSFLGLSGELNEKMGLGVKLEFDKTDILKQFNGSLSYAYRVKINEKARVNFGVSAMAVQNSIGYSDAVVGNLADDVVNGGDQDGMTFDAEAGVMLEYNKLRIGIASAHLFESGVDYDLPDGTGSSTFERVRNFRAYGSYQFEVSDNWNVEPFALVSNQGVESFQFEVNALSSWKETLYLGAGYRQEAGAIARVGFQVTDELLAAYAYEFSSSGVASYSNGSHEIMLAYRPKKRKKNEEINKEIMEQPVAEQVSVEEEQQEEVKEEERVRPKITEIVKSEGKETAKAEEKDLEATEAVEEPSVNDESDLPAKELLTEVEEEAFEKNIKFEFNKIKANLDDNDALNKVAAFLKKNPSVRIVIEGHTCNMGNKEVNTRYSNLRANSVKNYLLSKGVNPNQMETKAMLDSEPLVPNTSIENRQKNRRVEIELIE